jgi:hypothetical protein
MLWHVAQPFHARGLDSNVRIEAAGYGLVDDGLLPFLQELDQLLLDEDAALNTPVHMSEETNDGGLLVRWGSANGASRKASSVNCRREIQMPLDRTCSSH